MKLPIFIFLSLLGITVAHYNDGCCNCNGEPETGTKCPTGWMLWKRPRGNWCVKVFIGKIFHLKAEANCRAVGATLTGLQNEKERMDLAEAGRKVLVQNNFQDGSIWLGGIRKGHCQWKYVCFPNETFFWSDNHTTGTDGFFWAKGQPSASWRDGWGPQSCIQQFVYPIGSTSPLLSKYKHGELDDLHCQEATRPAHKLYACGKKAT